MKVLLVLYTQCFDVIPLVTPRLNVAGYSVTVMGQSDQDRVFHIRAMGVSTNSNERVGTFFFRSWSDRVPLFRPRAYLGDAAAAYANAAALVFNSIAVRLMSTYECIMCTVVNFSPTKQDVLSFSTQN